MMTLLRANEKGRLDCNRMRRLLVIGVFILCSLFSKLNSQIDLKDKLSTSNSSFTISVTVGGNFIVNGSFSAFPTERVDQFITRLCMEMTKLQSGKQVNIGELFTYPKRGILLKRTTGETLKIDLEKFRLTGDYLYNPYLKNDDVIIFPYVDKNDVIVVEGAVVNPCTFQFVEGDKVEDALLFAQGINPVYEQVTHMEIYRLTYDGKLDTVIRIPIDPSFSLRRGDRVKFVSVAPKRKNFRAYVDGEVKQPGFVLLPIDGLPIGKVLEQVGGLCDEADLSRAELIKGGSVFQSIYFGQEFERLMMQRMSVIKDEDSLTFVIDNMLRLQRGSLASSLKDLQSERVTSLDVIVRDGDYLFIPRKIDYVYVFGQVNNFGYVTFVPGKDYKYYIEQAGGLGETAKEDIYVIKNRTRAWYLATEKDVEIEPGDFIWVPKKPIRDFDYYLQRVGYIGSVLTGIATIILLFVQVSKQ